MHVHNKKLIMRYDFANAYLPKIGGENAKLHLGRWEASDWVFLLHHPLFSHSCNGLLASHAHLSRGRNPKLHFSAQTVYSRVEECLIAKHTLCKKRRAEGCKMVFLFLFWRLAIYIGSFRRRRIFGLAGKRYKHCGAERHNRSNFNDFICFCLIFQIVFMEKCLNSKQIHAKPPFPKFVEMSLKILWKTGNKWPAAYPPPSLKRRACCNLHLMLNTHPAAPFSSPNKKPAHTLNSHKNRQRNVSASISSSWHVYITCGNKKRKKKIFREFGARWPGNKSTCRKLPSEEGFNDFLTIFPKFLLLRCAEGGRNGILFGKNSFGRRKRILPGTIPTVIGLVGQPTHNEFPSKKYHALG